MLKAMESLDLMSSEIQYNGSLKILAIETSCDETAVALLEISGPREKPDIKVLGNSLLSQVALHEQYGGVYPSLAKREHEKNLPILLEQTLKQANVDARRPQIDCIAVTSGPGLEPALWTGITFAEELGRKWSKPVVPVNHMEGHIYSVLYKTESNSNDQSPITKLELPALALLVSGGHTELVYIKDFGSYEIIGRTLDDAVGEAFDKVARMLGLPYPGGPKISKLAEISRGKLNAVGREFPDADREQTTILSFPRPMIHSKDLNFSFSGLKTAVLYKLKEFSATKGGSALSDGGKEDIARAFEDAAIEVLVKKTRKAIEQFENELKTLIVAGGVSANTYLVQELKKLALDFPSLNLRFPVRALSTDNAIMIGIAAFQRLQREPKLLTHQTPIKAQGNLTLTSYPPLG